MATIRYFQTAATFDKLLDELEKSRKPFYNRVLKTCIELGWFTDGRLVTKLTENEKKEFNSKYGKQPAVSNAEKLAICELFPKQVTRMLDFSSVRKDDENHPPLVILTSGSQKVYLQSDLYQFLIKRHPKAIFHLTSETNIVALSHKSTDAIIYKYDKLKD